MKITSTASLAATIPTDVTRLDSCAVRMLPTVDLCVYRVYDAGPRPAYDRIGIVVQRLRDFASAFSRCPDSYNAFTLFLGILNFPVYPRLSLVSGEI